MNITPTLQKAFTAGRIANPSITEANADRDSVVTHSQTD
jgi:hypothetical protein